MKERVPESKIIKSILTLRYNPTLTPLLPKKNWKDFELKQSTPSTEFIEKTMQEYILTKVKDDSKISISLSGGVDSTLILSQLKKVFPSKPIEAISIRFSESVDETDRAAKIAEYFKVNHNIIEIENYLEELPKAINIIGMPFWDLHWYYVVKEAQKKAKYLASGDGGDELFGGYTFRYKKFLSLIDSNSSHVEKINAYLDCHERDRVPDQEKIFDTKLNFSWEEIHEILLPFFDNSLPVLEQVFLADYNGKLLYNFNPVNSLINSYFQVESIAPLLSDTLIDYSTHLDSKYKYDVNTNVGKLLLRKILQKQGASFLITEEKLGFNVNTLTLWKNYGRKICENYLLDSRCVKDELISKDWIEKYIKQDELEIRYINKFLGLLALEIWYRLFITKEMKPDTILN